MPQEIEVTEQDQALLAELDKAEAALDAQLQAQGAAAPPIDKGEPEELAAEPKETEAQQAAATEPTAKKEESTPDKTKAGTPTANEAEAAKAKAEAEKAAKEAVTGKEQTKYQKEVTRREKSWEKLNEEKSALQKEREAFEQQRKEFDAKKVEHEAQEPTTTPEDYEAAAKEFEKDGKLDLAEMARNKAKELREQPPEARAEAGFKTAQISSWKKAVEKLPELGVAGSETQKKIRAFIDARPEFKDLFASTPMAWELTAELFGHSQALESSQAQAARVPDLENKVKELTAEVEQLRIATAPSGGSSKGMPSEKTFSDMSPAEQDAEMQRVAAEADRQ